MSDYEKLGLFYLGRAIDHAAKTAKPGYLLYDSTDLVTHAVCVGMTGSGKTGLCIDLLEEAAIDRRAGDRDRSEGRSRQPAADVPEPRGRPTSRPGSTKTRRGAPARSSDELAAAQADLVEEGPGRLGPGRRPHRAAARPRPTSRIYTPGSDAGPAAVDRQVVRCAASRNHRTTRDLHARTRRHDRDEPARTARASTPTRSRAANTSCSRPSLTRHWRPGRDLDSPR